jgi:hypothetical protein
MATIPEASWEPRSAPAYGEGLAPRNATQQNQCGGLLVYFALAHVSGDDFGLSTPLLTAVTW